MVHFAVQFMKDMVAGNQRREVTRVTFRKMSVHCSQVLPHGIEYYCPGVPKQKTCLDGLVSAVLTQLQRMGTRGQADWGEAYNRLYPLAS